MATKAEIRRKIRRLETAQSSLDQWSADVKVTSDMSTVTDADNWAGNIHNNYQNRADDASQNYSKGAVMYSQINLAYNQKLIKLRLALLTAKGD